MWYYNAFTKTTRSWPLQTLTVKKPPQTINVSFFATGLQGIWISCTANSKSTAWPNPPFFWAIQFREESLIWQHSGEIFGPWVLTLVDWWSISWDLHFNLHGTQIGFPTAAECPFLPKPCLHEALEFVNPRLSTAPDWRPPQTRPSSAILSSTFFPKFQNLNSISETFNHIKATTSSPLPNGNSTWGSWYTEGDVPTWMTGRSPNLLTLPRQLNK